MHDPLIVRIAESDDHDAIWRILEPTLRAGETYALPRDMPKTEALAYWTAPDRETFVATAGTRILGTYFLRANQLGGGAHVANCGYVTDVETQGRGVARLMCDHSLERARARGFTAMQFNFVISTNERAIHLWHKLGFEIVGRMPTAFHHPRLGLVDALVMMRAL